MATFPFTISVQTTPSIQVTGVNVSYNELLNSFGDYCYLFEKIFGEAPTFAQINQIISFIKFNVTGNKNKDVITPAVDPYQKQASLLLDLTDQKIIADGRLQMSFTLLANSWERFTFFTQRVYVAQGLDKFSPNNLTKADNV